MSHMINAISYQINSFNEHFARLEKGKYNKPALFADYLISALRYGASATDYFKFAFYDKRDSVKKQFVCWKYKMHFYHKMNDYSKASIFDDKTLFLQTFKSFIKRDWLYTGTCTLDQFKEFCNRHEEFICKPADQSCGDGVRKEKRSDDPEAQFRQLQSECMLLEEILVQHHKMAELNSASVNTIRIGAVLADNEVRILGAALRCGSNESVVDNFSAGGLCAKIDPESGIIVSDGVNISNERFVRHPTSGVMFHGFQIPNWDKVKETVFSAARVVEGVNYIGWDVAILEDDVALVEGNFEGMMGVFQVPANQGIKKELQAILHE